jgi:tripartite-type tricarboxylate transporter receptor subunit TctC
MLTHRRLLVLAGIAPTVAGGARASNGGFPARPVRLVVAFPPGGSTDFLARLIAERMQSRWGSAVLVENRPGAGTTIGNAFVARSLPDGHVLLFAGAPFVISAHVYPSLPYDAQQDFSPVALVATAPLMLGVHHSVPTHSVAELVALALARPGELTCATPGNGSLPHLTLENFRLRTGARVTQVPYRGGAQAVEALVKGEVSMMFAGPLELLPHIRTGTVRPLATASAERRADLLGVPTFSEAGVPDFIALSWFGVMAPAAVPAATRGKIAAEIRNAVADGEVRRAILGQGMEPADLDGDAFGRFLDGQHALWRNVALRSGARPE